MQLHILIAVVANIGVTSIALASTPVQMHEVNAEGQGSAVGTVTITESAHGLVFTPNLKGLAAGVHGFHVHENPSCEPADKDGKPVAASGAGGHFDPQKTEKHGFPWGDGHLGDLPPLYVNQDGTATNPVLGPRLKKLSDISGRALMVHMGGDNHSDHPEPLGGGGARIACGIITGDQ